MSQAISNQRHSALKIHPLVPLAKASAVLKIEQKHLTEQLVFGFIKGELRAESGLQGDHIRHQENSWFIYADEFERLVSDQISAYENRISTDGLEKLFHAEELTQVEILQETIKKLLAENEELRSQIGPGQPAKGSALAALWRRMSKLF